MLNELKPAVLMLLVFTLLTGGLYPAVITGIAQAVMRAHANDWSLNLLGGLAALAMGVAAVALLASLARS